MTHSFVNIILPLEADRADKVDARLEAYFKPLQESDSAQRTNLRRSGLHFMSITVVRAAPGKSAHLVIEGSVDGDEVRFFDILCNSLAAEVSDILQVAGLMPATGGLRPYLEQRQVRTGQGLFDVPGLNFCGTPEMSVNRILDEFALARKLRDIFDAQSFTGSPLANLRMIRSQIAADHALQALLTPAPVPSLPVEGGGVSLPFGTVLSLALQGVGKFLWPVLLALAAVIFATVGFAWSSGWAYRLGVGTGVLLLCLLALLTLLALLYRQLRVLEAANQPDNSLPDPAVLEEVMNHEDWAIQNHLAGVSVRQPGLMRRLTLRVAFWAVLQLAKTRFRPGFLAEIGTIHFARWVMIPGTDQLLFFSNYGGSWGSYLEDFITKASGGLTAVWSNTIGFPRSENLFGKGATDGERFKRWARRQQHPTRFWYTAYPRLTTARIRANAAIRQGLASASTEDEAQAWFTLIGSASRPARTIEASEVQTLFFGGLKYHPEAASLLVNLPDSPTINRAWLKTLIPRLSFGEIPPADLVRIVALSASGLRKLGVGDQVLAQFPAAFRVGMAHPSRQNMLADTGKDSPASWAWGGIRPVDAVLNLYADQAGTLTKALAVTRKELRAAGIGLVQEIRLSSPAAKRDPAGRPVRFGAEHFGFADGVSQPIVRGTRRWVKSEDSIHTVEPGEFLLGYPDNRGYLPLTLLVPATEDPANQLLVAAPHHSDGLLQPNFTQTGANADRDFGRNGSYLVIRQLEQDVSAFETFLSKAAQKLIDHPAIPYFSSRRPEALDRLSQWLGAKMVGRWKDGTSLVRYPFRPGTGWDGKLQAEPDNDFLPGAEDPAALSCPYGAHIRRSFPRDSLQPGSSEQLAITNRHRILRRGRGFEAGDADADTKNPGLLFMCLNSDIERQFEFIQQTWTTALQFHGLENEVDPLLGRGQKTGRLTIPTDGGPVMLTGVKDFVRVRGGEYFFMPGRRTLDYMAGQPK